MKNPNAEVGTSAKRETTGGRAKRSIAHGETEVGGSRLEKETDRKGGFPAQWASTGGEVQHATSTDQTPTPMEIEAFCKILFCMTREQLAQVSGAALGLAINKKP